jgi:hypothetical protein
MECDRPCQDRSSPRNLVRLTADRSTRQALQLAVTLLTLSAVWAPVTGCARTPAPSGAEMRAAVHADATQMMADIDAAQAQGTGVGLSSNPFSYVGVSPAWGRLVGRGKPALDSIVAEIESSREDGLREYLLALAGQSILGSQPPNTGVSSGKGWARAYRSR